MRVDKRKALIAAVAIAALALAACSSSKKPTTTTTTSGSNSNNTTQVAGTKGTGAMSDCATNANNCNSGSTKAGGTMQYVLEKTIAGWNILAADSSTFEFAEVMDGLLPGVYNVGPDLKPFLETDVMTSATITSTSPQTVVYQIKPTAIWSDGTPINADDFVYAWKTEDPTYCPKCAAASTSGYTQIKSVTGSNNGDTVTVVFNTPFSDWESLFGTLYPAHVAAEHGGTSTPAGLAASFNYFDTTQPTYSGGPYMISNAVKDTSVTEVPNPKWFGAVKPTLSQLIFRVITDQTQEVPALQNNEVQAIYPQPTSDIVQAAAQVSGLNTFLGKGLTWEHLDFNEKNPLLADKQLRLAIFTAIDRQAIINRTIGLFVPNAQPLNNHMYVPGQPGYQDNVTASGQGSGNATQAKSILTAAGYTGVGTALKNKAGKAVKIRCSYTVGNTIRQQTCQLVQSQLAALGITVTPTPITDLGGTLASGDFDLIDFAWVGTPFVVTDAQGIFELAGGGDYGFNKDPAEEALLNQAGNNTDPATIQRLVNEADVALTNDAYNLPLYQKPTYLAAYANLANIRDNSSSVGPPYNVQDWGIRTAS